MPHSIPSAGPVSGRTLRGAVADGYLQQLFPGLVADDPTAAKVRIAQHFGCFPSADGTNIEGIVAIRDKLFALTEDTRYPHALMIAAPHTHWSFDTPIVIRMSGDDYAIGPCSPRPTERYVPVSFVFSADGPLAFEWVDESIPLDQDEISDICDVIRRLNVEVHAYNWPLGISLNFRFKPLFSDRIVATVEFPIDDYNDDVPALIVPIERYPGPPIPPGEAQVAWHAYSDFAYGLDDDGVRLLRELRKCCQPVTSPA
jgi:hypothetical protein